jgi:hypothetical protein
MYDAYMKIENAVGAIITLAIDMKNLFKKYISQEISLCLIDVINFDIESLCRQYRHFNPPRLYVRKAAFAPGLEVVPGNSEGYYLLAVMGFTLDDSDTGVLGSLKPLFQELRDAGSIR